MSVKLFFRTHGRFPTTDEFRLLRSFYKHQPPVLTHDTETTTTPPPFQLLIASRLGAVNDVASLIPQMQNLDQPTSPSQQNEGNTMNDNGSRSPRYGVTPLCAASQGGHLDVLALLINSGASVDVRGPQNRPPLLFAAESGHFNTINYLISRGATIYTYRDQQIESYFISYCIRQAITRRELSYVLPGDVLPGLVLDFLGLGGQLPYPIERLNPVNHTNKNAFGATPIPSYRLDPIPHPHPTPTTLSDPVAFTPEEWEKELAKLLTMQE